MVWVNLDEAKMKKWKSDKIFNTETMLPISEIKWNTVILKDWGLRGIIRVYWLNLDLRNYDEQQIVIEQYKRFLNWLWFPIQIYIRNTYLDLTDYIEYMKDKVSNIDNEVLKWQWDKYVGFLDEINSRQGLIYTKEFYIVVPYYDMEIDMPNVRKAWWKKFLDILEPTDSPDKIVWRYRKFIKNAKHLDTRCNLISEWLKSLWIVCERLEIQEIISLLFKVYNPNSHKNQSESN